MSLSATTRVPVTENSELSVYVCKSHFANGGSPFRLEAEFTAAPGVTVLLGHSGAGKTTLLRCIAGLHNPDRGRITIGNAVLFDAQQKIHVEAARRNVAFVFQDLALFPHLTVWKNVAYGLRRVDAAERQRRMDVILESFQIAPLRNRLPHEISGGERQRVALARSLVTGPSVLLLDEPLSSLDERIKSSIIDDLHEWNEAHRIPMLYVTHSHEEVLALGQKAIVLQGGRIMAEGSPLDVVSPHRREIMAPSQRFENFFDATVTGIHEQENTVTCRVNGSSLELDTPLTRVALGAKVRLGIPAGEILFASVRPEMVSPCNLVRGRVKRLGQVGKNIEVCVDCGVQFRLHLPLGSQNCSNLGVSDEAWLLIKTDSCHLVRAGQLNPLQRLFVFVCTGNTIRSPMAQAICNAQIASRLRVPLELQAGFDVQALSAGLSVQAGTPMTKNAQEALCQIGIPPPNHSARSLDSETVAKAEVIFCMTEAQRQKAIGMFAEAAPKIQCLRTQGDIDDPKGKDQAAFITLAKLLDELISERLGELGLAAAE